MPVVADADLKKAVTERFWVLTDPEMPAISLADLGVVHAVDVTDGAVRIELLPTFLGCPALDFIRDKVRRDIELLPGVEGVDVRYVYDRPWTTDDVTAEGRRALRDYGIAPPVAPGEPVPCPYCASTETERSSRFGPAPCRMVYYCNSCRQPFEAMKTL
jgi:ring-1,2-phenylacetyl-CoA epoxidase subunit PaaD